jgi:hypothetical protein
MCRDHWRGQSCYACVPRTMPGIEAGHSFTMKWTSPKHSRGAVDRSGRALCAAICEDRDVTLAVVDNWRSAHSYPLHALTMNLRRRVAAVARGAMQRPPSGCPRGAVPGSAREVVLGSRRRASVAASVSRHHPVSAANRRGVGACR